MKQSELAYMQDITMSDLMYGSDTLKDVAPELTEDMFGVEPVNLTSDDAKTAVGLAADVTPFVGSAKALTELPEDAQFAYQLLEEGYDEGSIKKMGLGAGFGVLTAAGFLPGAKIATDLGQRAIKEGVKETAGDVVEQTRAAFRADPASMDSEKKKRLIEESKRLPSSRRRQFIKEGIRPTPKLFHGAPSLGDADERFIRDNQVIADLQSYRDVYVDEPLTEISKQFGEQVDADDFARQILSNPIRIPIVVQEETSKYASLLSVVDAGDFNQFNAANVRLFKLYDDDGDLVKTVSVPKTEDNKINMSDIIDMTRRQQEETQLETDTFYSNPEDIAGVSRASQLEKEGSFQPYTDTESGGFTGARGMTSDNATGKHAELKEKAISLSRDPLVSMKDSFGGKRLDNIMVSELPKSIQRNLSPIDYDSIQSGNMRLSDVIDELNLDEITSLQAEAPEFAQKVLEGEIDISKIGISLPKSLHLEAEVASRVPERFDISRLSDVLDDSVKDSYSIGSKRKKDLGKLPLKERVREGQKIANTIVDTGSYIEGIKMGGYSVPFKDLKPTQRYNIVKQYFNDLQSLGQFTEQYGARGTYDSLLETTTGRSRFKNALTELAFELPVGSEKKNNMKNIIALMDSIEDNMPIMASADQMTGREMSGLKDKTLLDRINKDVKYNDKIKRYEQLEALGMADDITKPERTSPVTLDDMTYNDAKRAMFLLTQKLNRGGLMAKR